MHSNFPFKLKHLSNGRTLLCGEDGFPVLVDETGRVRTNQKGQPMTVRDWKPAQGVEVRTDEIKVELKDYRTLIQRLYQPRMNLRSQQIEVNGAPLDDAEFEELHIDAVEQHGYRFKKGDFQAVLRALAVRASYDPVYTYLDGLGMEGQPCLTVEEWDQIAVSALGLGDSWSRTVLQKTLLSAVARVMQPGCQVDYCLILHGTQGEGKSSLFRALAGDSFSDSMGNLDDKKDDLMILHRHWFNEWSEADQVFVGANKAEKIKRFVSAREDTFRAPYGRTTQAYKRRSILCGTTNRDDWANDPTGNRRFPVLSPNGTDAGWTAANRDRIWARAVVEYRKGSQWWFTKEEEQRITERASQYGTSNDEVETAFEYLKLRSDEWFSTKDLMVLALDYEKDQIKQRDLNAVARQLNALISRGACKKRMSHQSRISPTSTRITTTCWSMPSEIERSERSN